MSLVDTVLIALALAFLVRELAACFGDVGACFATAIVLCVLPLLGALSVAVWKDVPETAALLVLQALLVRAARGQVGPEGSWYVAVAATSPSLSTSCAF